MDYRIKLTKLGRLKYISHLDWQNTILKALNRSGLKLVFSEGFNPTPRISFSPALPIYLESETEFIDLKLAQEIDLQKLQNAMPEGIKILSHSPLPPKTPSLDITCQWAKYIFEDIQISENLEYNIKKVLSDDNLFIKKKNKKGIEKSINIRKSIKSIKVFDNFLEVILKTGQNSEIPALRADEFAKLIDEEQIFKIKRVEFYDEDFKVL